MDDVFVCGVLRFLMPDGAKNGGCFRQEKGMEKKQHRRFAGFDLARRSGRTTLLGDGLDGWLASHGMQARHHMLTALWQNWDIVMGTELAPLAHPLGHRGNILLVGGDDSCAMQELSYAVPEILERVNAFMDEEYFHKVELHLLLAVVQYRTGQEEWRENLQACVSQAESYHFVRLLSREGSVLLSMLEEGEPTWKDRSFRKQVLEECGQMKEFYPRYLGGRQEDEIILSENAVKILRYQSEGLSSAAIAEKMKLSEATVKYHSRETYRKLGVKNKTAAIAEAKERKMI